MDKKTAGLIGAIAGLATIGAAQATTTPAVASSTALQASSYADLLEPISNASELLKADNAMRMQDPGASSSGRFQLADWGRYEGNYHHHHHHHRYANDYGYYRRNDHHHHHHHNNTWVGVPGVGGVSIHHGH